MLVSFTLTSLTQDLIVLSKLNHGTSKTLCNESYTSQSVQKSPKYLLYNIFTLFSDVINARITLLWLSWTDYLLILRAIQMPCCRHGHVLYDQVLNVIIFGKNPHDAWEILFFFLHNNITHSMWAIVIPSHGHCTCHVVFRISKSVLRNRLLVSTCCFLWRKLD